MVPAFSYNKFLAFAPVLHPQTLHVPSSLSLDRFAVTIWNLGAFGPFLPFRAVLPVPLGIGTLGRRVAPHSVPYTISQVCVCVCAGAQVCAVEVATLLGGPQIGVIFKLFLVVTLCLANFSPLVYVVLCLNR